MPPHDFEKLEALVMTHFSGHFDSPGLSLVVAMSCLVLGVKLFGRSVGAKDSMGLVMASCHLGRDQNP